MELSTTARSLIVTVHTMGFTERRQSLEHHKKMVSERMNRMIMERARCMRLHAEFPLQLWDDAVNTVVYLINRGPSSALDGGTPKEAWTRKKVNYSFFKTFGCEAFVHIDK